MSESNAESPNSGAEKPWLFQKGQSGNPGGKPKSGVKTPQILRDMRRVYSQDECKDRTPGEKLCRQWLQNNPKGFFQEFARLDQVVAEVPTSPQPEAKDERQEKIEDLIDGILGDINREQAKEDAELAKRPNAAEIGGSLQERLAGALEREECLRKRLEELERGPTSVEP